MSRPLPALPDDRVPGDGMPPPRLRVEYARTADPSAQLEADDESAVLGFGN
jgi:hypothetical protein